MYLLDTDVLIDIQREYAPALTWFATLTELPAKVLTRKRPWPAAKPERPSCWWPAVSATASTPDAPSELVGRALRGARR